MLKTDFVIKYDVHGNEICISIVRSVYFCADNFGL